MEMDHGQGWMDDEDRRWRHRTNQSWCILVHCYSIVRIMETHGWIIETHGRIMETHAWIMEREGCIMEMDHAHTWMDHEDGQWRHMKNESMG